MADVVSLDSGKSLGDILATTLVSYGVHKTLKELLGGREPTKRIEVGDCRNIHEYHKSIISFECEVPQEFGIFASIIARAHLSVQVEAFDPEKSPEATYWVLVNLSYDHPGGGRNGSNVVTMWLKDDFSLLNYRFTEYKA